MDLFSRSCGFQLGQVNYEVEVNGEVWKRHVDQLLICKATSRPDLDSDIGLASFPETSTPSSVLPLPGASVLPEPIEPMETAPVSGTTSDRTGSLESLPVVVTTNPPVFFCFFLEIRFTNKLGITLYYTLIINL